MLRHTCLSVMHARASIHIQGIIKILWKCITWYRGKYDTVITRRDGIPVVSSSAIRCFCIVMVRPCSFFLMNKQKGKRGELEV